MKKKISYIGTITLIMISFFITEQTTAVIKETDEIMKQIKENKEKYEQQPISAQIKENKIIPGINGKKVNLKKTYEEMKKIGNYNPKYYIFEEIKPEISIENIYDKYIEIGNIKKNIIALIIKIENKEDIEEIINIVKKQKIKITFLINNNIIKENKNLIQEMLNSGNIILTSPNQSQNKYCYTEEENIELINRCAKERKHTIKPYVIKNALLKEIKKINEKGKIIAFPINNNTKKELELTIKYIKSKGYNLVNVEELISEKNTN